MDTYKPQKDLGEKLERPEPKNARPPIKEQQSIKAEVCKPMEIIEERVVKIESPKEIENYAEELVKVVEPSPSPLAQQDFIRFETTKQAEAVEKEELVEVVGHSQL